MLKCKYLISSLVECKDNTMMVLSTMTFQPYVEERPINTKLYWSQPEPPQVTWSEGLGPLAWSLQHTGCSFQNLCCFGTDTLPGKRGGTCCSFSMGQYSFCLSVWVASCISMTKKKVVYCKRLTDLISSFGFSFPLHNLTDLVIIWKCSE